MSVLAYVPDLMDRSRFGGFAVEFVTAPEELARAGAGDLVVADLSRPGVLDAITGVGADVNSIGFGSHVDRELLGAATAAGWRRVMARSEFFRTLPELLAPG